MKFGNVETNIETIEQYISLISRIIEWYVELKHPGYKVVSIEVKEEVVEDGYGEAVC